MTVNLLEPPGPVQEVQLAGSGDSKVLLMDLSGVISSQEKEGLLPQPNMLATFKEELTKASKDDKVKAVVLRINSPGGTVNASDILYHELKTFKANKKIPVIASMMDVAASGGYYLAMAADAILVHPSTVTGSIGVIMLTVNARGLLEKVGVEANAITSGPRKDMGSPFRIDDGRGESDFPKCDRFVLSTVFDGGAGRTSAAFSRSNQKARRWTHLFR